MHGREAKEWSKKALRSRIAYLKDSDLDIPLPAGDASLLLAAILFFNTLISSTILYSL